NLGKSYNALQKTLDDKGTKHTGAAAGFDVFVGGKPFVKQQTKLLPKKHDNKLYAELVALKLNIAASQLGKTPAGFGELIFDVDTSAYDEMEVKAISEAADNMMTNHDGFSAGDYDALYNAAYAINRAFLGPLDTASFMQGDSTYPLGKLVLLGQGNLAAATYLKLPVLFRPTMKSPTTFEVESGEETDFEDEEFENGVPVAAKLYQNYPNPFNPATTISFRLLEESAVTIKIFNMLGQEVATLLNGEQIEEGIQVVEFAPATLASGVYFYRIEVQGLEDAGLRTVDTRKMVLLK
ncbi:MAG: T9SS type A sorting domain-containing protein, partial [Bacteroidota bacterium]